MATVTTFANHPRIVKFPTEERVSSRGLVVSFTNCFHKAAHGIGQKSYYQYSHVYMAVPYWDNNLRRLAWQTRSSVNGSRSDPSPSSSTSGRTRLVRAIQDLQTKIVAKVKEIRENLPLKLLFFLVGFYCATAFSTVIGQTGDWDILSAALAVAVVEGIGALMYRSSFHFFNSIKSLITMFNYWKAGLSLGLFLDSFKYEADNIMNFSNPFYSEMDIFSPFL